MKISQRLTYEALRKETNRARQRGVHKSLRSCSSRLPRKQRAAHEWAEKIFRILLLKSAARRIMHLERLNASLGGKVCNRARVSARLMRFRPEAAHITAFSTGGPCGTRGINTGLWRRLRVSGV